MLFKRSLPTELREYYENMTSVPRETEISQDNMFGVDIYSGVSTPIIQQNLSVLNAILASLAKEVIWSNKEYNHNFWFLAQIVSYHYYLF